MNHRNRTAKPNKMNKLARFENFALTRGEMKSVGGGCGVKIGGQWYKSSKFSKAAVTQMVQTGQAQRWCCASC